MADVETTISNEAPAATAPAAKSPKVKKTKATASGGVKKPKTKPNHPPTSEMVQSAIKALKERGGSSLQAIKKYISATYKIDADKLSPFIKKYLKGAVTSGQLVQTKGKGASGSFKISAALKPKAPKKSAGGDKSKAAASSKKAAPKKASGDKKPKSVVKKANATGAKKAATKKPASDKKKAAAASAKSAKKTGVKSAPKQKPTKPKADAVKKPKTPKPKKAAPKKAAAKK